MYSTYLCNGNAIDMAQETGIDILEKRQYAFMQTIGSFDMKTKSWFKTSVGLRKEGLAQRGSRHDIVVWLYLDYAYIHDVDRAFRGSLRV